MINHTDVLEVSIAMSEVGHNRNSIIQTLRTVGRLAWRNRRVYFEYSPDFLTGGLEISPFKLPLKPGIHQSPDAVFEGLFGVFNDSLPDGWGRLLMDRHLAKKAIEVGALTPLDRLTYVGAHAMGALQYKPDYTGRHQVSAECLDLDFLSHESQQILAGVAIDLLDELFALNSASAGARPKVMVGVSHDKSRITHGEEILPEDMSHWMIKFQAVNDSVDAGTIEFAYSLMARDAGIEMPPTHLFSAKKTGGFFGVERFDRQSNQKIHMHTASGLLHADHRYPSMDYQSLLRATWILTKDVQEVLKLYRMAVFNILAHNRDDHAKNFAFLMDASGNWKVAPAYDLTFSPGPAGEHCMMVHGEGKNPTQKHLEQLAKEFSLNTRQVQAVFEEVSEAIHQWPKWAKTAGVLQSSVKNIEKRLLQVKSSFGM